MRSKFKWIFTLLLALSIQFSFAQEKTVTGVVSDASGTLPGANVVVKGTTRGTQTDVDGKYAITAKPGDVLIYSFVGMTDSNATVGGSNTINITLQSGVTLDAVVIDGYKTTTKKKSSISQTTISAETFEGRPNVSFLQSLQSQVAGLNIATSSGSPGSSKIDVILRGVGSVNGSTEPLFVIDGVPANQVVFRGLNNEDIENITVLKDAGATAIYGNRGANGVIVIQTKRGKYNSKMEVRVTSTTGFTELQQNNYNMLNGQQELELEKLKGVGKGATLTDAEIAAWTVNTNWQDVFFRTGLTKNQNVSFTQGGENMTNFTSLSYFDQDGIVPTTDFKRFTLRSNFIGKSKNDRFNYSTNLTMSYSQRNQLQQETTPGVNANVIQNPLQGVLSSLPWIDPNFYINGESVYYDYYLTDQQVSLPLALIDYIQPGVIPNQYNETKILANASGTYKLTDALSYKAVAAVDYSESKRMFARNPNSFLAIAVREGPAEADRPQFGGIELLNSDRDFGFNLLNQLNYNKVYSEKHTVDVSLFTEYIKAHRSVTQQQQTGLDPRTWVLGAGTGYVGYTVGDPKGFYVPTVSAFKADAGLFSYFATADYDYNSKYGVVATIRRDASYKFIEDNQWATFWSVSARWNMDEEAFMNNSGFDVFKVRASYGTTGNQNIVAGAYGSNPLYLASNLTRDLNAVGQGYNGQAGSIFPANIANPDLRWETTTQGNIGFDFTYKKRLSGTIDVYQKVTDKLFDTNYVSATNATYGIAANTDAKLINTGVEVQLNYDIFKKGDFRLDVFVNGSYNKNEWKDLIYPPGEDLVFQGNVAQKNGKPLNAFYLAPYLGVNPENGNLIFRGADGLPTETIDDEDRRFMDENYIPSYQGGFGLNASYKGFFLNSNFSFVADVARFDFDLALMSDPNNIGSYGATTDYLRAWTEENTGATFPSINATNTNFDGLSDRFLKDASYVRLKNVILGYDVPAKFLDKTFLSTVRVYGQAENFVTWSNWRGFDVEGLNASNQGGYPSPKVISFGLDISF